MKPFAYVVYDCVGNPRIWYNKEQALDDHKHISSKKPIGELFEKSSHCVKESFDAGYHKAIQDIQILSDAVDTLKDFASSVGGSSSFWQEIYNDDFDTKVFTAQMLIIRVLSGYNKTTD